jgi:hypothetical protein
MKEVKGKGLISGVPLKDADEKRKALEDRMPPRNRDYFLRARYLSGVSPVWSRNCRVNAL